MIDYLHKLRARAESYEVTDIASVVLDNPRFAEWSGSSKSYQHHYGTGGLIRHTFEVAVLAELNRFQSALLSGHEVDQKEMFLAVLFHDIGKTKDYTYVDHDTGDRKWSSAWHKRIIHHISASAIEWSRAVDKFPQYRPIEESVLHAILAHHGQREWGSPIAPRTRLAWLLHFADCISARMNDADTLDVVQHYKV